MQLAQQAWRQGRLSVFLDLMGKHDGSDPETGDARGFEWYYLRSLYDRGRTKLVAENVGEVYHITFAPDDMQAATANQDGSVCIWEVTSGRLLRRFKMHDSCVNSLAFSPDGKHIATVSCDKTVKWWHGESGDVVWRLDDHTSKVTCVAIAPDGEWLISGSDDGTAKVWDVASGQLRGVLPVAGSSVESISISEDGSQIAIVSGGQRNVRIWDAGTLELQTAVPTENVARLSRFVPGRRCLLVSESQESTALVTLGDRQVIGRDRDPTPVSTLEVFANGHQYAIGDVNGVVRIRSLDHESAESLINAHDDRVAQVAVSQSDAPLLATACYDGTACIFNMEHMREFRPMPFAAGEVTAAAISGPVGLMALAHLDGSLEVRDLTTGHSLGRRAGPSSRIRRMVFSHDGGVLQLHVTLPPPQKMRKIDIATSTLIDDSDFVVRAVPRKMRNLSKYVVPEALGEPRLTAFSWDARFVCVDAPSGAAVYDVHTGSERSRFLEPSQRIAAVTFSPDGKTLATAGSDHSIRLWHVATGQEMIELRGHTGIVSQLAFAADNKTLVSWSHDPSPPDTASDWPGEIFYWHCEVR